MQVTSFAAYLLGLLSDSEDGDIMLVRRVSEFLTDYTASHPERY
jgi:hypothetical protein